VLDTLAMAYAESGRFREAQQTLQRAIEIARASGHADDAAEMQQRLRLYRASQPFRETPPNDHSSSSREPVREPKSLNR
jgi:hypothetical protein